MLFDTQEEREAIINLMLLARFTDKKLTVAERDTFTNILSSMYWEDVVKSASFVSINMLKVRDAAMSESTTEHFLNECCDVFTTNESKQTALQKIINVMHSDGITPEEKALYERIKTKISV